MGMCLDGRNQFSAEIRSESIVLAYGPPDGDSTGCKYTEFLITELEDLQCAIDEARQYLIKKFAEKHTSTEDTRKLLKRDWKGRYVQLRKDVKTRGGAMFRAGEVFEVYENRGGITIERKTRNCGTCGRQDYVAIKRLPESLFILLEKNFNPENV